MVQRFLSAAGTASAAVLSLAATAMAQEPQTEKARKNLDEICSLYQELNGMVATAYGAIGTHISDRLRFATTQGRTTSYLTQVETLEVRSRIAVLRCMLGGIANACMRLILSTSLKIQRKSRAESRLALQ